MNITLHSTDQLVDVYPDGHLRPGSRPVKARIWEGTTDTGIPVYAVIPRIAVPESELTPERERALAEQLKECKPPALVPRSYDLRFFLD